MKRKSKGMEIWREKESHSETGRVCVEMEMLILSPAPSRAEGEDGVERQGVMNAAMQGCVLIWKENESGTGTRERREERERVVFFYYKKHWVVTCIAT
jgi:hypothetical protein